MTEAMPFLQKYDITFLRPPAISAGLFFRIRKPGRIGGSAGLGFGNQGAVMVPFSMVTLPPLF